MEQSLLTDDPGDATVAFDTSGRVIRPLLELPAALVDECKLRASEAGLSIRAVDPANVGMIDLDVEPAAFDAFDADETTLGCNVETMTDAVADARLGESTDDPVSVTMRQTQTNVEIEREYGGTTVRRANEFLNLDPDSIRQEPDIPDLDFPVETVSLDPRAFVAAMDDLDRVGTHATMTVDGADVVMDGNNVGAGADVGHDDLEAATRVTFPDAVADGAGEDVTSVYSLDYLTDFATACKAAKVDGVQLHLGDSFPLVLTFHRTDDDGGLLYAGEFMLAPRIGSDGGDE